jgi:DegV family protein with EDD domain
VAATPVVERLNVEEHVRLRLVTIHMTSRGSGAYQSALAAKDIAREMLPDLRVEVVDTLEGLSLEEVVRVARDVAGRGTMIQTAETLRYLYLGGRIGKAQHLVGSALKIRPLIGMEDGIIVALGKAHSQAKAYRQMASLMRQKVAPGRHIRAAFTHVAALEEAEKLCDLISQRFDCSETLIAELSPSLGVHTGPGSVRVCCYVT